LSLHSASPIAQNCSTPATLAKPVAD
jgi:hypothetical protein